MSRWLRALAKLPDLRQRAQEPGGTWQQTERCGAGTAPELRTWSTFAAVRPLLVYAYLWIFTERLALADLQTERIPRSVVFWAVWCAAAFTLAAILYVPVLARLFRVSPVDGAQVATAIALGVVVVAWRLLLSRPIDRTSGNGTR